MNLTKGYEGELKFYYLLQEYLTSKSINLFDLRLELNKSEFQVDSLLVFQNKIFLIEVKNFDGDFVFHDDSWYSVHFKKDIQNPLQQLKRCELLLKETFHQLGIHLPIESFLIFINPTFTLYNSPRKQQIVFPGQLHRFLNMLNNTPSTLTKNHRELKEELIHRHITVSSREILPKYNYEELRKGIICINCGGVLVKRTVFKLRCESCQEEESTDSAILRSVHEFQVLFPSKKITVNSIYNWCSTIISKGIIRRVLADHLEMVYRGKYSYYINNKLNFHTEFPNNYKGVQKKAINYFNSLDSK